jgi:hypothetical protein
MIPLVSDRPLELRTHRICQVFRILLQSESPIYLNSNAEKKLQNRQWLISATLPEFNHLQGTRSPTILHPR